LQAWFALRAPETSGTWRSGHAGLALRPWRTPFTFGARLALGAVRAAGTGRANGACLALGAKRASLALRARRTVGAAFAPGALRARLALKAASHLQRQQDIGRGLKTLDRSYADFAAFGAERKLLAGLGRSCAGLGLPGVLFLDGLGHGEKLPRAAVGR
jgi:hypothetical protein